MDTNDFKHAADRHYRTCVFLLDKLYSQKKRSNPVKPSNREISSNVYYLSGYIVECIFKYHILSCKRYQFVSDEDLERLKLKSHCLSQLFLEVKDTTTYPRHLPYQLPKHYQEWGPHLRYERYKKHKDYVIDLRNQFESFVKPLYCYFSAR